MCSLLVVSSKIQSTANPAFFSCWKNPSAPIPPKNINVSGCRPTLLESTWLSQFFLMKKRKEKKEVFCFLCKLCFRFSFPWFCPRFRDRGKLTPLPLACQLSLMPVSRVVHDIENNLCRTCLNMKAVPPWSCGLQTYTYMYIRLNSFTGTERHNNLGKNRNNCSISCRAIKNTPDLRPNMLVLTERSDHEEFEYGIFFHLYLT